MKFFNLFVHKSPHIPPFITLLIRYRYVFFSVSAVILWMDSYIYTDTTLIGLYSMIMVFLGLVYANVLQGIFNSMFVTIIRFSIDPSRFPSDFDVFFYQWISYFAIWFAVSLLIKMKIDHKENLILLTSSLANTLDARDKYTAFHSDNVARYARLIAKEMHLSKNMIENIYLGGKLHDIGKIGIPEHILNKPEKLTDEEFALIKRHPEYGYHMVKHISDFQSNGILDAIFFHHERLDGYGYPSGLSGEVIPLMAKIIAVADSFDAMTSHRVYRKENSFEFAVNELRQNKGTQFDSKVVDAFLKVIERQGERILKSKCQTY